MIINADVERIVIVILSQDGMFSSQRSKERSHLPMIGIFSLVVRAVTTFITNRISEVFKFFNKCVAEMKIDSFV